MNHVVIHADDLGLSRSFNAGILEAAQRGILTSTCLRVNGSAYVPAVREILPAVPHLGVGLHLNIVEGRSTRTAIPKSSLLCHSDGTYRLGFGGLYRGTASQGLLQEIEADYRDQFERALRDVAIDHVNSHQHSHGIPPLFALVCRLAESYKVPYVRLPRERAYVTPPRSRHWRPWFAVNLVKRTVLNHFAVENARAAAAHGRLTNDWMLGIGYTGFMDADTVRRGLEALAGTEGVVEVLLHPTRTVAVRDEVYLDRALRDYVIQPARLSELATLQNGALARDIRGSGRTLTHYRQLTTSPQAPVMIGIDTHEPETPPRPPLTALAILDETPFHHPEYLDRLIRECPDVQVVAAAIVELPGGGVLKKYLLKRWRQLGIRELAALSLQQIGLSLLGRLPVGLRGTFNGSVRSVAERHGRPYRIISKVNTPEFLSYVEDLGPDLIISSASPIFSERLIALPKVACINRHSAILPACGGILPVFRSIQQGHAFTGASVHYMVKAIDKGRVLSRKWLPIFPGDTLSRLYRLCFVLSFDATVEAIRHLRYGIAEPPLPEAEYAESYFSYPDDEDWAQFRRNGGRFI